MPTVLRVGPFQFGFFAADRDEPPHVHVSRDSSQAKFWLLPEIALAKNKGFSPRELNVISKLIVIHRDFLLERWNEFFGE